MNYLKILPALFLLFVGTGELLAQDVNNDKNNYVILSKNIQQLKPILITVDELRKEDGEKFGSFKVVFCGNTLTDIPRNENFAKVLDQAKTIEVYVCGLSLQKFNISQEDIPEDMIVIENGILYGFQLKKNGFITITI